MHKYAMNRGEAGGGTCTRYVGVVRGGRKNKGESGAGAIFKPSQRQWTRFREPIKRKTKKKKEI